MDPFDLRQWPGFKNAGGNMSSPAITDQITIDSRCVDSCHALFVALEGEKQDGHQYVIHAAQAGAKYALVHQRWQAPQGLSPLILLRVDHPLRAFQEIAKTYRLHLPTQIVGITGSFGKTMAKDLLQALLCTEKRSAASPESFNSQIGVPLSLLTIKKEHEVAIIEAAISEKSEMDVLVDLIRPTYTILAPVGKKHLATLETLSIVAQETMKLILATPSFGWALISQHPLLQPYYSQIQAPCYFWDQKQENLPHAYQVNQEPVVPSPYQISFPNQDLYQGSIQNGYSYFLNLINMTVKAAWLMGISSQNIKHILTDYQPEPMRTEIWKTLIGTTFINDVYCSDPQSIDQALKHFHYATENQRKIFVFGGMRDHSIHSEKHYQKIGKALNKAKIDHLVLFGNQPFKALIREVKNSPSSPGITICSNNEEALTYLKTIVDSNDLVLIKGEKKIGLDTLTEAFNESLSNNRCIINFDAIRTNLAAIRKKLPLGTHLMMIVKALAYGTDDVRMSKFLFTCHVDILGVSYVDEGVSLKRAGVKQAIFAINAAAYEAAKVIKWDLEVGVSDLFLIQNLEAEAKKWDKQAKVHLHINTGMGRLGCCPEEALTIAKYIISSPYLSLEGLMTHFACAENPEEDAFTRLQTKTFDRVIQELKANGIEAKWLHAANSGGAIRFHLPQYNMVRIGLAAYGLYSSEAMKKAIDLRLALSLTSRIVGITVCKKGETVGYGRSYIIEKERQKIAVLPIGYFDGLHRQYSGKSYVIIRGMKAPMVGKICMDYMMVDVTEIPEVTLGDRVLIFGEDEFGQYLSPEDLAASGNSIIHELITCLGPRIQRIFVHEEKYQIR